MSLPTSRNRNYIDGATNIPAQDMNDLQDYLISAYAGYARGASLPRTKIITPLDMSTALGWALQTGVFPYWDLGATTSSLLIVPLPVTIGERILAVNVLVAAAAVVTNVTSSLRKVVSAAGGAGPGAESTIVAAQNMPAAVTTMQRIVCTPTAPGYVTVADEYYFLRVVGANSAGTKQVMRAEYVYDVP